MKAFHLSGKVIDVRSNWAEDVVSFLHNPIVSSILIMIGVFGLFAEIKHPGFGLPGVAGIIALLLFFGSSYILDLASVLDIILFIIGVVLLLLEIFVIPGFGVAGVLGIILVIASLFLALIGGSTPFVDWHQVSIAIIQLASSLVAAIILLVILAKFLPKSNVFSRLVLATEENADKGFVSSKSLNELIGKEGKALTTLRPAGMADFDGEKIDVVADGDYVQQGSRLRVLRVEGSKVVVREIKS